MGDSKNIKRTTLSGMGPGKVNASGQVVIDCMGISLKRFTDKAGICISLLIFSLLVLSHQPAYSSGVGFLDHRGEVTVSNSYFRDNFIGILATTTNAASIANDTIDNIRIYSNDIYDSLRHGIKIDLVNTGAITIENNLLDNNYVPSTGAYTKNGRFGIRIRNHPSPSIANNTVRNFGRSGIQLLSVTNISVANNVLFSNGSQGYSTLINGETRYFGSGLQAINSVFTFVVSNTITSNRFSGIADNLSTGTIGPNNTIMYNGDPSLGIGGGGGVTNCVIAAGGGGLIRGGVLAFNLPSPNDTLSVCNNNISNNYSLNVGHTGIGSVYSCSNKVVPFFATADDTIFYFDGSSGQVDLDCLDPGLLYSDRVDVNATIDAAGKPFGIIIEGEASDVTVTNCTIKNAAMNETSRATTGNGSIIGAGIFVVNNAEPSISNNYLFSNGWALLDDRIYTEAGASGIQMRCSGADTRIFSNIFEANANDGLVVRESGGFIGESGRGNTFLNNARGGIGIYDGTTHNLEIAYNFMHSNQRGIGVLDFDGDLLNITGNRIYSNQSNTSTTGGINFKDLSSAGTVTIANNTITNNSGWKSGGIGLTNSSLITVDFNIFSNTVSNNDQSGIGIQGARGFTIRNNLINENGVAGFSIGDEIYASGIQLRDSSLTNEAIVDNTIHSNYFAGIATFNVGGTIGRSGVSANDIRFNGNPEESGGLCAGVGGNGRGGISARGLTEDLYVEDPSYIVTSNYTKTVQLRPGSDADLYYNGAKTSSSFWSSDDVALEIAGNITYDCVVENTKIRGGKVWGITVVGDYTATIKNCSIYNNCTDGGYCDGDMGGGVLIAGGANVYMDNNIVFSNGYGAQAISLGKCAGVAVRCAGDDTTLVNNTIENNLNDGLVVYDTNGYIGISGAENTIRNNGRHGIGLNSFDGGTSDGPVIAYNRIYSNTAFGIGSYSLTNMNATILNNIIYSNHVVNTLGPGGTDIGGGIGLVEFLSLAKIEGNTVRNNPGAKAGGIGVTASNGTVSIVNNIITSNTAPSGPGGIGIMDSGGIIYVGGNTITYNQVNTSTFYPAGIGVLAPTGGTVIINDNVIASNVSPTDSHVGGIALTGNSAGDRGVLSNVYITSNRISNHRFGATGNQGAIAFRWMDFSTMFIRNNNKDGLGLSNNGAGIRFHSLADGVDVSIQNNIIRDNITPEASGGSGIEFMNTNYINVDMDSNIISNCGWKTPGNGDNKAVIAFQNCNQYSTNYIQMRSNQINSSNAHGIQFTAMNGVVAGGHVAKIYIGTDQESPGASNNIINLPAEMRAIEFRYNDTGDIGVEIKNNNNLEGGIALSDNMLYYLTITGNSNIFSGQKGTDADAFYAGIQARNNVIGLRGSGPSNLMPITISDNGIRDNRHNGMMLIAEPVYCDLSLVNNTIEDNGRSGMSISLANVVTIQNNTIVSNGLENFNANGLYDASGIRAKDSTLINVTGNTIRNNLYSGIAAYNSGGTIGNDSPPQENLITQNGNPDYPHLCEGIGNGRGGISARDLDDNLYVYDANLIVTDNYHDNNNSKPGMASGNLYYNDVIVENDFFDASDAVFYYNSFEDGAIITTLDCLNPTAEQALLLSGTTIDASNKAFGVVILGPDTDVTVQNCEIKNAAKNYNFMRPAIEDKIVGAGILLAANANTYIFSNYVHDNGTDLSKARFADGAGGTMNNINFHWTGGGAAGNEAGTNQFWVSMSNLSVGENYIYLYAGNAAAPVAADLETTFVRLNEFSNEDELVSLWHFDNNYVDSISGYDATNYGTIFGDNNYQWLGGLAFQNYREDGAKHLKMVENAGEYGYLKVEGSTPDLDLQEQTILVWFAQGPGTLYARKPITAGCGGVELTTTEDLRVKFQIEQDCQNIYTVVSPADSFSGEESGSTYVAALFSGAETANGKMKLFINNTLVASTDVPTPFTINYGASRTYIAAGDADKDDGIDALSGETFEGYMDELAIYDKSISNIRIDSHYYMRNYGTTNETNQPSWPTVVIGDPVSGSWTVDGEVWPTRWPVTIGNVLTTLAGFQIGPIAVESPDSGGIIMRCVDGDTTVVNNTLSSNKRDGLSGYSLDSVRIGDNSIRNNERFGIGMRSTVSNARIYSNEVHDNDRGIGGSFVHQGAAPFTIVNNHIKDNESDAAKWKRFGIMFTVSNGSMIIEENTIENGWRGIGFQNQNEGGYDITIRNNSITNQANWAMMAESWTAPNSLYVENNYVTGTKGIMSMRFMSGSTSYFTNNNVDTVKHIGFQGNNPGNVTLDNNTFNNITWAGNNGNHAAVRFEFLDSGDVVDIRNNTFTNSEKNAIMFQDSSGSAISITNNYIYNNSSRAVGVGGSTLYNLAAIRFQLNENLSTVYIYSNDILNNYATGVMFRENEGTDVTIDNNDINYNGDGVEFRDNYVGAGGNSITIKNCNISNNTDNGVIFRDNYDGVDDILVANNTITYNDAGVWVRATENARIEGNNLNYNDSVVIRGNQSSFMVGPSDSYIFSFQRSQCFGGAKKYLMKDIFNTGMPYNDTEACSGRGWFAYEFMADEPRFNEIRWGGSWGIQVRGFKNDGRPDNNTVTEWRTAASDTTLPHSLTYNLGTGGIAPPHTITQVRIYAHYEALDWDVYCDGGATPITSFTAGGDPQVAWYYSDTFNATCSSLKLESDGGYDNRIYRDFFELHVKIGGSWYNMNTYDARYEDSGCSILNPNANPAYYYNDDGDCVSGGANPYGLSSSVGSRCSKEDDDEDWGLDKARDGSTTTQWVTHPGDFSHKHWIAFDLGSDVTGINGLQIYTGTGASHSWNAYVSRSVMTPAATYGTEVKSNWTFGGSSGWQTISFTGVTGRYIRMETTGIDPTRIKDHFYAIQYTTDGGQSWDNPPGVTGNGYGSINASGPMACSMMGRYSNTLGIIGGQYRGAASNETGQLGDNLQAYMYATFMGGGVETVAATDGSTVIWENSSSHGNNLIQCKEGATVHMRNGSWLNQKTRTESGSHLWIMDHNYVTAINCMTITQSNCSTSFCPGPQGGTTHVIDHSIIANKTNSWGSVHIIFNGGNMGSALSACSGGTMEVVDGNFLSNILWNQCWQGTIIQTPNCNTLSTIDCHPTGGCTCSQPPCE